MLAAFAPMATDMYLPAFAQMSASFACGHGGVKEPCPSFSSGWRWARRSTAR